MDRIVVSMSTHHLLYGPMIVRAASNQGVYLGLWVGHLLTHSYRSMTLTALSYRLAR